MGRGEEGKGPEEQNNLKLKKLDHLCFVISTLGLLILILQYLNGLIMSFKYYPKC